MLTESETLNNYLPLQGKFLDAPTAFDEVNDHLKTVDAQNCRSKSKRDLVLRPDTVAQLPVYNELLDRVWYKNRSTLIHLHNMALNRAMFYSYILQKMNDSASFYLQPNWLYMYMSVTADVNANPSMVNGSAIYFDTNCHYPNWYTTVNFNKTLPLFGPKAWRHDDYQDQDNILREPTHRVVEVADLGAGKNLNYTSRLFKMNPWYSKWLPDLSGALDSLTKFTYYVGIKYSNETGRFINDEFHAYNFFGPSMPSAEEKDERLLPVVFTQPYFDCGASNKWVVSTVSPIVDYMPRYSNWTHLRRQRYVGVVVMDTYFMHLDFNACGVSAGNPGPSYLSGTHRCRPTTGCKHKMGYGFRRGGYICHCAPGRRYPWSIDLPYQGDNIEQATEEEYRNGFTCTPVNFRQVLPMVERLNTSDVDDDIYTNIVNRMSTNSRNKRSVSTTSHFRNNGHGDLYDGLPSPALKTNTVLQSSAGNSHTTSTIAIDSKSKKRSKRSAIYQINQEDPKDKGDKPELGSHNSEDDPDVRPPVEVPRGMHVDCQATHDQKPISRDQLLAAQQRRQGQAAQQKKIKETTAAPTPASLPKDRRRKRERLDEQAFDRVMRIFRQKEMVTKDNCYTMPRHNLLLAGDVAYGANKQFEPEARTALRLSHFLSNFLQNSGPMENFGHLRGGGRLHVEHVFGGRR
ncbi:LOW QUALITY PROTEIN: uncharacterized protein LOC112577393 [Pomacea canaliculata]|uniref:LOW QUALITY PROTEIN: uncharacterized protein LOC112577393 n=1 Tax=Pomacea canaliculata TaxID=400727 RepID=UPI000D73F2F1|nr:LOW QUALITY PROTEIN: uncharacterized protein LOC112577393 [Pomacea canaliculata]